MKFIVILLACLSSLCAQAQDRGIFTCSSTEGCVTAIDSLLCDASRKYTLCKSFVYRDNKYVFDYKGVKPGSSDSTKLRIVFIKRAKGANPALEIEGVPVYELQTIDGKYIDIFPVWKKYVDPSADIEAVAVRKYCDRKKFDNPDGSGEEYKFKEDTQDKSNWQLLRSSWYKSSRL